MKVYYVDVREECNEQQHRQRLLFVGRMPSLEEAERFACETTLSRLTYPDYDGDDCAAVRGLKALKEEGRRLPRMGSCDRVVVTEDGMPVKFFVTCGGLNARELV